MLNYVRTSKCIADEEIKMEAFEIAIIAVNCRFPGANNTAEFWENLARGRESVVNFRDDELLRAGAPRQLIGNTAYVKTGTKMDGIDLFDAEFFGLTPKEAQVMDPQIRHFLEAGWETFELGGYNPRTYPHPIGVYAGMGANTYLLKVLQNNDVVENFGELAVSIANEKDYLTTTVSYRLNLRGPSVAVHTACSTSLVAVHLACQSLRAGECRMALAGGVALDSDDFKGYLHQESGILSPDGHCRAFDAKAQGTAWGKGLGLVLLKPLKYAQQDGDLIYAVIKGSAINNDGASKVGFTAPSTEGQERVIRSAHAAAGITPETISYVEAHGTGTLLGDPIEIEALVNAFKRDTTEKQYCALGSVKSNIGHADAAAGVAGLIKVTLALFNEKIPPTLNCEQPNPAIDFENGPFFPNTQLRCWAGPRPLRAGVSSFGIGGTNAHVVVEQAPTRESSGPSRRAQLLLLSARTTAALEKVNDSLATHLKSNPEEALADVAYTLQIGRQHFRHRRFFVCDNIEDAITKLDSKRAKEVVTKEGTRQVVFAFGGQGAQSLYMAQDLYRNERTFRDVVDHCSGYFRHLINLDLRDVLYPREHESDYARARLSSTAVTQPALFMVEYALACLWMEWGIDPGAMLGHSLGDYIAACIAGVMTLEDGMRLVAERGRLMEQMQNGGMLAVALSEKEAQKRIIPGICLAAVNGRSQCVFSGETGPLEELEARVKAEHVGCERLSNSHAFHSHLMDPMLSEFERALKSVKLMRPRIPIVSSMTGRWLSNEEATDVGYWVRQARQTVRFGDAVQLFLTEAEDVIFLEVTPRQILSSLIRSHASSAIEPIVISSASRDEPYGTHLPALLKALGEIWVAGATVNWDKFYSDERRLRVALPTYPFDRRRHWVEPAAKCETVSPAKVADLAEWFYVPTWIPAQVDTASKFDSDDTWLIFTDSYGLGSKLAKALRSEGKDVYCVTASQQLVKQSSCDFAIVPDQREHYEYLWNELRSAGRTPRRIVHLWSVIGEGMHNQAHSANSGMASSFFSLLHLGAVVGEQNTNTTIQIYVVSDNLYKVDPENHVYDPVRATLLGPTRALNHEYSNVQCRHIDVSTEGSSLQAETIQQLLGEFALAASDEVVAYRNGVRWGLTFRPHTSPEGSVGHSPIREDGVYLISGGLGGLGLTFAKHIARESRTKIVLVGRSAFPSREDWPDLVRRRVENSDLREKILDLMQIEQLGSDVMICTADVSDRVAMREIIRKTKERFGALNGVIHAAGVAGGGVLCLRTKADAELVLNPKVAGTLVLDELLKGESLDFFVLCASLTGVLGSAGQVDYIAANAFQDAYSHWRRDAGAHGVVSIDWDGWADVGMLANYRASHRRLQQTQAEYPHNDIGDFGRDILPKEGWEVLKRVLCTESPSQIAVSTVRWENRLNEAVPTLRKMPSRIISAYEAAPANGTQPADARVNKLEECIATIWQQMLGVDNVSRDDDFIRLGGNSLIGIQITARIRQLFEIDFTVVDLYEHPTVGGIANAIVSSLIEAVGPDAESISSIINDLGTTS